MNNKNLESIISSSINKLYSLAYAIVPNELEAEQLLMDSYTRFILKDKELILDTDIEDASDKNFFKEYSFKRIIQEIYALAQKRARVFKFSKKMSIDEFNVFYTLSLESRVIMHLNTVLDFDEQQIAETLLLKKHEVVKLMYQAKNELLEIKENEHGL